LHHVVGYVSDVKWAGEVWLPGATGLKPMAAGDGVHVPSTTNDVEFVYRLRNAGSSIG
jgi:hypothetical protein